MSMPYLPSLDQFLASISFLSGFPGVLALMILTALMVVLTDWRFLVLGIGVQSVLLSILATRYVPPEWALLRAVTGGLIAIMWFLSARAIRWGRRPARWLRWRWPPLSAPGILRLVLVIFIFLFFLARHPRLPLPGFDADLSLLSTWLVAMGLLALALGEETLTAGIGLIWWLEAAHLYYPAIQKDPFVAGVLGAMKLLIGLACAYLIAAEGTTLLLPGEEAE